MMNRKQKRVAMDPFLLSLTLFVLWIRRANHVQVTAPVNKAAISAHFAN